MPRIRRIQQEGKYISRNSRELRSAYLTQVTPGKAHYQERQLAAILAAAEEPIAPLLEKLKLGNSSQIP